MENKAVNENQDGISRSVRDVPPAHYTFKIESFSSLLETKINKCESSFFNASRYRWKLSLYPNGRKERNGDGHISLYLTIIEKTLPLNWQVNVNFKLFLFDHIRNNYLTIQDADAKVRQFHENKKEWGFDKFISLNTFNDLSNGYLLDDCCVFGVEVHVIERSNEGECLKFIKEPADGKYTWKIDNFSTMQDKFYHSPVFTVGNSTWKIKLYPKGYDVKFSQKGNDVKPKYLSIHLTSDDWKTLPVGRNMYVHFSLIVKDQKDRHKHIIKETSAWLGADLKECGVVKMMLLRDLDDESKGFLVKDTMNVKARLRFVSVLCSVSK